MYRNKSALCSNYVCVLVSDVLNWMSRARWKWANTGGELSAVFVCLIWAVISNHPYGGSDNTVKVHWSHLSNPCAHAQTNLVISLPQMSGGCKGGQVVRAAGESVNMNINVQYRRCIIMLNPLCPSAWKMNCCTFCCQFIPSTFYYFLLSSGLLLKVSVCCWPHLTHAVCCEREKGRESEGLTKECLSEMNAG